MGARELLLKGGGGFRGRRAAGGPGGVRADRAGRAGGWMLGRAW